MRKPSPRRPLSRQTPLSSPVKLLFAGIDGSGKTSCLHLLIAKLESDYRILKIGNSDPCIFFEGKTTSAVKARWYQKIDYLRTISVKYHFHGLFLLFNFLYKYLLSKYLESYGDTDIIMYESDTLLHPSVYITYHFPWTKKLSPGLRFRIVYTLFRSKENLIIFYLDTDPSIAVDRIQKRNINIQPHENCRDLGILKREFEKIVSVASRYGLDILEINTDSRTPEEVTREMEIFLEKRFTAPR